MNRNIILIALLGLLCTGKLNAQSVTVEAKIDSLQILIGEQARVVAGCDGCQTACSFSCIHGYADKRCGNCGNGQAEIRNS